MKELKNLLKIKSLWSLVAMAVFIYLVIMDKISGEIAMATVSAIVTYYFVKHETEPAQTSSAPIVAASSGTEPAQAVHECPFMAQADTTSVTEQTEQPLND